MRSDIGVQVAISFAIDITLRAPVTEFVGPS